MRLPYFTADLPGTGGFLRTHPEDFRVDESALYEPSGEGKHVYFRLWKRGIDTFEAIRRVARALDLPERAFGYAGLKDSRAVTTQWVSTDAAEPAAIEGIKAERLWGRADLKYVAHGVWARAPLDATYAVAVNPLHSIWAQLRAIEPFR